jgi:ribosome recycling factor
LGLNPNNDGKVIHLNLPPLTEERRRDLVKHVHHRLEESRVAVRNIRRDAHNDMRDFEKEKLISEDDLERGEVDLQKLTDRFIEEVGEQGKKKEAEIMEV